MKKTIVITTIGIFCILASQTQAVLIEIDITAEVTDVGDHGGVHLEGSVNVGDTITGKYVYDSDASDSEPSQSWGLYEFTQSPYGIFLEVGGLHFYSDPTNTNFIVSIVNESEPYNPKDIFYISSDNNISLPNGYTVNRISWQLTDDSGQAILTDELPLYAPQISDWTDGNRLVIQGGERDWNFYIIGEVTSATLIPEPISLVLLTLGCLGIRKRNRK